MNSRKPVRKFVYIFIILLAVVIFVSWFDQKKKNINIDFPLDKITMEINGWNGENLPTSAQEKKWFEDGDLITRQYIKGDDKLYLVAIQERGDRHRVHSPVDCYSGSGWMIKEKETLRIGSKSNSKTVRRMYVVKNGVPRFVYYWFSNGDDQCASFKGHLLVFLRDIIFTGSVKSWVCFQVSADIGKNPEVTGRRLEKFIYKLGV